MTIYPANKKFKISKQKSKNMTIYPAYPLLITHDAAVSTKFGSIKVAEQKWYWSLEFRTITVPLVEDGKNITRAVENIFLLTWHSIGNFLKFGKHLFMDF